MEREFPPLQFQPQLKHFIPINTFTNSKNHTPFSAFCKSFKNLYKKAKESNKFGSKRFDFDEVVVENSSFLDDKMDVLTMKSDGTERKIESFVYESSLSSDFLVSEGTVNDEEQSSSEDSCSTPSIVWHIKKNEVQHCDVSEQVERSHVDNRKLEKQGSCLSGIFLYVHISILSMTFLVSCPLISVNIYCLHVILTIVLFCYYCSAIICWLC